METKLDNHNIIDYNKYQYVIDDVDIEKNNAKIYRQILLKHNYITIVLNDINSSSIEINNEFSFLRIIQLAQLFPEETVMFTVYKGDSLSISLSKSKSQNNQSISNINENKNNYGYDLNQKLFGNKNNLNKLEKNYYFFYYYMKCLYYIYLLIGIIILIHYMFIILKSGFSKFFSYYTLFSLLLIMFMLYLGYFGSTIFNGVEKSESSNIDENYNHDYLFWFNFTVTTLTMISFIFLLKENHFDIKKEKYFGVFIIFVYIFILLVEIIALLFFDLTKKIFEIKVNEGYTLLETNEEKERLINI